MTVNILKRCPFCNGRAELITPGMAYAVMCDNCKAMTGVYWTMQAETPEAAKAQAVSAWNRRKGV